MPFLGLGKLKVSWNVFEENCQLKLQRNHSDFHLFHIKLTQSVII